MNIKGEIYFQSFRSFFIYDGEKVRKGVSDLSPLYIFHIGRSSIRSVHGGRKLLSNG